MKGNAVHNLNQSIAGEVFSVGIEASNLLDTRIESNITKEEYSLQDHNLYDKNVASYSKNNLIEDSKSSEAIALENMLRLDLLPVKLIEAVQLKDELIASKPTLVVESLAIHVCKLEPDVGREVISRENSLISNLSDESIEAVGCDAKADSETKLQSPIENLVAADSEDIASNLNPESLAVNVYAEIMLNLWDSQLKSLSNKIEYSPSHQKHIDSFSNSLEYSEIEPSTGEGSEKQIVHTTVPEYSKNNDNVSNNGDIFDCKDDKTKEENGKIKNLH
jgi:hypothetical protein